MNSTAETIGDEGIAGVRMRFMDGVAVVSVRGDAGDLLEGGEEGREKGSTSGKGLGGLRN